MKPIEIEVKIDCARREMEYWKSILSTKHCFQCGNWDGSGCEKAAGITPPVEVQKTGCQEWEWNCIPF